MAIPELSSTAVSEGALPAPTARHPAELDAEAFVRARLVEADAGADDAAATTASAAALEHAAACAAILAEIDADPAARAAAWLFGSPREAPVPLVEERFGPEVAALVDGMRKLRRLGGVHRGRDGLTRAGGAYGAPAASGAATGGDAHLQDPARLETLRRMLLTLSRDVRLVLLRLASRLATLRLHAAHRTVPAAAVTRETLDVLAPLANRLGLWQLKWELEDLAFRFDDPPTYRELARGLEEKRADRAAFVEGAITVLREALARAGVVAEISGRPKHIYSIWRKMRGKSLSLDRIHDLRGLRVIVSSIEDCYAALGVIHQMWRPLPEEYDDYIARPKPNGYRSLHTVVVPPDGRSLEVQVRTREMHEAAEYGLAAHWRYKEGVHGASKGFERQVAWLRQLLAWQHEIGESLGAHGEGFSTETAPVYALTPQGRVIELPPRATPVDFAYALHTELGHACRGARVDGRMVPLNTPLDSGQTVEIVTSRRRVDPSHDGAGPSRDWLNPELGYLRSTRARTKVRQWFAALELAREQAEGRAQVERVLQREGRTSLALERLAKDLNHGRPEELFVAVARGEIGPRALETAVRRESEVPAAVAGSIATVDEPIALRRPSHFPGADSPVLIEGVGSLLTQLAKCCRPAPPDEIAGFVTRGHGVTVHRTGCTVFQRLAARTPERVLGGEWAVPGDGGARGAARAGPRPRFTVEVEIHARDRSGLLRDVTDVMARQGMNVTAARTQNRGDDALMRFTVELETVDQLGGLLAGLARVPGVSAARRR